MSPLAAPWNSVTIPGSDDQRVVDGLTLPEQVALLCLPSPHAASVRPSNIVLPTCRTGPATETGPERLAAFWSGPPLKQPASAFRPVSAAAARPDAAVHITS